MSDLLTTLEASGGRQQSFAPGAFLFLRGDPVQNMYAVQDGTVHLQRMLENGSELTLQRCGSPAVLAEASLFSESYHCDATAVTPARVLSIPKGTILRRLKEDPEFALSWAAYLSREVQQARSRSELLTLRTVAERLDAWIGSASNSLPPKGRWKSVAAELGVSPEALYRELSSRSKRGKA